MTDRERLIEWIEESRWIEFQGNILTAPARQIADYLIQKGVTIPVRCGECKHSGMYCFGSSHESRLACLETEEDGFVRIASAVTPDFYCGYGEGKEE